MTFLYAFLGGFIGAFIGFLCVGVALTWLMGEGKA